MPQNQFEIPQELRQLADENVERACHLQFHGWSKSDVPGFVAGSLVAVITVVAVFLVTLALSTPTL